MKFSPPRFVADQKLYISDIQDGETYEQRVEAQEEWKSPEPELQTEFDKQKDTYISLLMNGTRGWFTKPLTAQWLSAKCAVAVESPATSPLSSNRSGTLRWKLSHLEITKETFRLLWKLIDVLPDPIIELEEEAPPPDEPPSLTGGERAAQKQRVLAARRRAARALYKAERLIQEYCALWGEDTDWEDEESDASSGP